MVFKYIVVYRDEINHKSNTILKYKTQADSVVSGTNAFINFWFPVHGDTRRETQFLKVFSTHTILSDHPHPRGAFCDVKISDGRDPMNPTICSTVENSTRCLNGRNSTLCLHGPISTDSFSKSANSQDHLFRP